MKIGTFEIKCTSCGSEDIAIINRHTTDDCEDEIIIVLKCKHCKAEIEL